jgi:pimeloyl-ACP methyl ester carboxylesterase
MGVRLVVVERPGIGESTRHVYPNIAAAADDVLLLADRLGVDRFATAGLSGGGPYALACAARSPDRVTAVAVLGGVAPAQGEEAVEGGLMALATRLRVLLEFGHRPIGNLLHLGLRAAKPFTSQLFELYVAISPEGDRRVFRQPGMKQMFTDDLNTAVRRQAHAPVLDILLFTRPWGFLLREITVPVRFWHGDADNIVPLAHAEHMAALVPDSELRVRPAESHLGGLDAMEEMFRAIVDLWPNPDGELGIEP